MAQPSFNQQMLQGGTPIQQSQLNMDQQQQQVPQQPNLLLQ